MGTFGSIFCASLSSRLWFLQPCGSFLAVCSRFWLVAALWQHYLNLAASHIVVLYPRIKWLGFVSGVAFLLPYSEVPFQTPLGWCMDAAQELGSGCAFDIFCHLSFYRKASIFFE